MSIKRILSNNYFYYSFLTILFSVIFYFTYSAIDWSDSPVAQTFIQEKHRVIGGTPPYYEGHDDQIEPNPNK